MKKTVIIAVCVLSSLGSAVFGQNSGIQVTNAIENLKYLLTDHTSEKAFLQLDRPYACYSAGETIYFKAYVTAGERHEPSTISNVLHVDLIDNHDKPMETISLPLINGTGWGNFTLPDTLTEGVYRIRAYTQWMRNEKIPDFFNQDISVSSINNLNKTAQTVNPAGEPSLQFFPEGGTMADNEPAIVAFKAIGPDGLGMDVKGAVVDDHDNEVAVISSAHLGMGEFSFVPEAGKSYKAIVTFGNGSKRSVELPAAQAKGITLSVNTDDPAKISITVRANHAYFIDHKDEPLDLVLYYSGTVKRYSPKLDAEVLGLDLPVSTFPTGILKTTLFSGTGEPLNERLTFIQNASELNLSITPDKPAYTTRGSVTLAINAKNADNQPVVGSFSVSVVDESKIIMDDDKENSILSYLLLTSELKGYIEKPGYYFNSVNKVTRQALDVLMLTQGYRRFTWKDMEDSNPSTEKIAYQPEKSLFIAGKIVTKNGQPVPDCSLALFAEKGGMVQTQETDASGHFSFPTPDNAFGNRYILKMTSSRSKKNALILDKGSPEPAITALNGPASGYNADADLLSSMQDMQSQGVMTASNGRVPVMLKNEKAIPADKKDNYRSSSLLGPGHADQVVLEDQIKNKPSLSTALNGVLRNIQFNNDIPILRSGEIVSGGSQVTEPMYIVVDGVELGTGVGINTINPADVEAVEVFDGPDASIYGMSGGQGVLVITTKSNDDNATEYISKEMSPGIFSIQNQGYFKAREFYSPAYQVKNDATKPDNRTTIYWKPDIVTDSAGNATVSFYNADGKGNYRVEIEGIDSKGNLGRQVLRYKVQ